MRLVALVARHAMINERLEAAVDGGGIIRDGEMEWPAGWVCDGEVVEVNRTIHCLIKHNITILCRIGETWWWEDTEEVCTW